MFNASDGVLAEGEYTHSASFVQRDCRSKTDKLFVFVLNVYVNK